jgi:prepilin-type N-terminal cleavage/methylation domain-containing protein
MITRRKTSQNGFSAVELMITLIIASIFLFSGYQLYVQVTRDGADADRTAKLSNILYERVKKEAALVTAQAPTGCAAANEKDNTPGVAENISGIGSVTFITIVDCPYSTTPGNLTDIFYVRIEATYSNAGVQKKVEHATFAS